MLPDGHSKIYTTLTDATEICAQTERKRQDRSVRCAEKHHRRARTQRFPGLIRPVPAARVTAEAAWREKGLSSEKNGAILVSDGSLIGECRR